MDYNRDAVGSYENHDNYLILTLLPQMQKDTIYCFQAVFRQNFAAMKTERGFSLIITYFYFVLFLGMPTVDRFLSHLGDPGRYQVIIMILMAANCIPVVVNHLLMAFYVPFKHTSNHNCRVGCLNVYIHTYMSFNNTPGSDVPTQFLIAP